MKKARLWIAVMCTLTLLLNFFPVVRINGVSNSLFSFILGIILSDTPTSMGVIISYYNIVSLQAVAITSFVVTLITVILTFVQEKEYMGLIIKIMTSASLFVYSVWLGIMNFALEGGRLTVIALLCTLLYISAAMIAFFGQKE